MQVFSLHNHKLYAPYSSMEAWHLDCYCASQVSVHLRIWPEQQPCLFRLSTIGGKRNRVPIKDSSGRLLPLPRNLRVCTMSADFWGLPTAGGTATAYGLLTSALSEDTSLDVRPPVLLLPLLTTLP